MTCVNDCIYPNDKMLILSKGSKPLPKVIVVSRNGEKVCFYQSVSTECCATDSADNYDECPSCDECPCESSSSDSSLSSLSSSDSESSEPVGTCGFRFEATVVDCENEPAWQVNPVPVKRCLAEGVIYDTWVSDPEGLTPDSSEDDSCVMYYFIAAGDGCDDLDQCPDWEDWNGGETPIPDPPDVPVPEECCQPVDCDCCVTGTDTDEQGEDSGSGTVTCCFDKDARPRFYGGYWARQYVRFDNSEGTDCSELCTGFLTEQPRWIIRKFLPPIGEDYVESGGCVPSWWVRYRDYHVLLFDCDMESPLPPEEDWIPDWEEDVWGSGLLSYANGPGQLPPENNAVWRFRRSDSLRHDSLNIKCCSGISNLGPFYQRIGEDFECAWGRISLNLDWDHTDGPCAGESNDGCEPEVEP